MDADQTGSDWLCTSLWWPLSPFVVVVVVVVVV
jgi:hypothetical protein